MVPKRNRMNRSEFDLVFKQGRVFHGTFLYIKTAQNEILGTPIQKFSCVVSKKVAKQAVERHLLKRQVYSILRREQEKIEKNRAIIVIFKKQPKNPTYTELETDLKTLLTLSKSYAL